MKNYRNIFTALFSVIQIFYFTFNVENIFSQWSQTNGPYGAFIHSLTVLDQKIYAATDNGGIYISTNNGSSWISAGLYNKEINAVTKKGNKLFAGTFFEIYQSTDEGANWTVSKNGLVDVLSFVTTTDNIVAGTGFQGVILSTDNGDSWIQSDLDSTFVRTLILNGNDIYAGTIEGIYKSTNSGLNWNFVGLPGVNVLALAIDGNNIFAGNIGALLGILLSTDNGNTWNPVNNGLISLEITSLLINGNKIYAGTTGNLGAVYESTNNGSKWERIFSMQNVNSLKVFSNNIFAGTGGSGVFKSNININSWINSNFQMPGQKILSMASKGNDLYTASWAGIFHSTNNGTTWTSGNNGLPSLFVSDLAVLGNNIYSSNLAGVYYSDDNFNWYLAGLTSRTNCLATKSDLLFAGTFSNGVYLTTNAGVNWSQAGLSNRNISCIEIDGNYTFAGVSGNGAGVYRSNDNGATWTFANNGIPNQNIQALVSDGSEQYAGTLNGVFRTTNSGDNWTSAGLSNYSVLSLMISDNNLFAGTNQGTFLSTNNGVDWINKNQGFDNVTEVNCLLKKGEFVYSGSNGQSVWKRSYDEVTPVSEISQKLPESFSLSQNYPNPFNPKTIINYKLRVTGHAKLKVFDVLGNEVAELVNEKQNAGSYSVEFDGSGFSSGVYFYKLEAGDFVETKCMVLLK